jgi:hypothetical protein
MASKGMTAMTKFDLKGKGAAPESWACIDCGINTAPGFLNREQMEQAFASDIGGQGVKVTCSEFAEVYQVKPAIWKAAGMEPWGGCLCVGCLEKRLGRTLTPKDFLRDDPFKSLPSTERLAARRGLLTLDDADIELITDTMRELLETARFGSEDGVKTLEVEDQRFRLTLEVFPEAEQGSKPRKRKAR